MSVESFLSWFVQMFFRQHPAVSPDNDPFSASSRRTSNFFRKHPGISIFRLLCNMTVFPEPSEEKQTHSITDPLPNLKRCFSMYLSVCFVPNPVQPFTGKSYWCAMSCDQSTWLQFPGRVGQNLFTFFMVRQKRIFPDNSLHGDPNMPFLLSSFLTVGFGCLYVLLSI